MDPALSMGWEVHKLRCFVCEARAEEAKAHVENGGSIDGMYFRVTQGEEVDE